MFTVLIVQPIFNLLVAIYALIPGHNLGLAIILFTITIRLLLWPLVKKQLYHAKAIKALQPEVKKIKQASKGDRQKETRLLMELYKERQINPFASIGILIVQIPIFIGLYYGLKRLIDTPQQAIDFAYPLIRDLPWMQTLATDISRFDETLVGLVDLARQPLEQQGVYWPGMLLVVASAVAQYFQSKQLMPQDKEARSLKRIMKEAGQGKAADQSEVNAAVSRGIIYLIPLFVFFIGINLASALSLYFLTSALVAMIQQSIVLKEDETELVALADKTETEAIKDTEPIKQVAPKKSKAKKRSASRRKRRKR